MILWADEIKELDKLYASFIGYLPNIVKELEQLIKTEDQNVVMLYSRRCLEVIIIDLYENELKRPRKFEPLKDIIDKLNSEEKVPSHIITLLHSLKSMSTYCIHPKDFDLEQVKLVLINLTILIRWYLRYKDTQIVSRTSAEDKKLESKIQDEAIIEIHKPKKRLILFLSGLLLVISIIVLIVFKYNDGGNKNRVNNQQIKEMSTSDKKDFITDSRDGQRYKTVKIGTQIWLAEDLRTTSFNNGIVIPLVTDKTIWAVLTTPAYCWYNNDEASYKSTYGALYNWYAVSTGKICPIGWHIPTDNEWKTLEMYLGMSQNEADKSGMRISNEGGKLKETGTTHWTNPNVGATNESGFTALPGGYRSDHGSFHDVGGYGHWWSVTVYDAMSAWDRCIDYDYAGFSRYNDGKRCGFSVRCVRDY
ncbi:MAG: fibrobacter succinogenes major paralogous domain-containing protein [Bacteroidales bacterium]|jgi:uncharacterized protein (TIGR02145 family)